jgi:glutamate formiminotransferase/formiminotetrahydrofolate cyclodeaminase
VANLSSHKPGWDDRWEEFSQWAEKGQALKDELLHLVDEDTRSFNLIMDAFGLPKKTDEEKAARKAAIQDATKYATMIPFRTMEKAAEVLPLCMEMAKIGNPNSVSDAGVGALAAVAGVRGAYLNVLINASGLEDKAWAADIIAKAETLMNNAIASEKEVMDIVLGVIKG